MQVNILEIKYIRRIIMPHRVDIEAGNCLISLSLPLTVKSQLLKYTDLTYMHV